MPPINQGSRAGLITTVVVFVILFVASTIFAIYYGLQANKTQEEMARLQKDYTEVVTATGLQGDVTRRLRESREAGLLGANKSMKLLDVASTQISELSKLLAGVESPGDATIRVNQALDEVTATIQKSDPNFKRPNDLAGAVMALRSVIEARQTEIANLTSQLKAAQSQVASISQEMKSIMEARDKMVAEIRTQTAAAVEAAAADRSAKQGQVTELEQKWDEERKGYIDAQTKLLAINDARAQEIEKLNRDMEVLRTKLAGIRNNPSDSIMRQADGEIIRVASTSTVYINRGQGDQISPGMTFEVYDRAEGIPSLDANADESEVPKGKASIEVVRVGPNSSEARVVRATPNQTVVQGDFIVNLIYDPATKYNFFVYGEFDVDGNGVYSASDAEIIKRLITQWGARVTNEINTETDFVVFGREPEVPEQTGELDPLTQKAREDAIAALEEFLAHRQEARDLHIPILNQNRFLYYIGYYELAKR